MKNNVKYIIAALLIVAFGCTKDFDEIDRPKTTSDLIEPDALFTRALVTGSGLSVGIWQWMHQISGSVYAQHLTNIQVGANFTSGNYEPRAWNVPWDWYYAAANFAPMMYMYHVIELSQELENPKKEAVARIWNVFLIQQITDMYGDMPVFEAFENIRPAFDSQKDIYLFMLNELKTGVELINQYRDVPESDMPGFDQADVMYQGDLDMWEKFANSMILRLALRASNTAEFESQIRPFLNDIDPAKTISDAAESAVILPDPAGPTFHVKNPLIFVHSWNEVRMSTTMYNILTGLNDPRMEVFFQPNQNGEYAGLDNGLPHDYIDTNLDTELKPNYNNLGTFFIQEQTPHFLLTAAEVNLMLAEAAHRGFIAGNAEEYYNQGITASFTQLEMNDPQVFQDYIDGPASFDAANALNQIWTQRWLALFPNGHEAWSVVRRTGVPEMMQPVYTFPGNEEMPRRKPFPDTERQYNAENYQQAVARMGGDSQYTRLWWDGGN